MRVELRAVGMPVAGGAAKASSSVAPQTSQPPLTLTLPEGEATVALLLRQAEERGIPVDRVSEILLNGSSAGPDSLLHDGDAVTLIGQLGGV